MVIIKRYSNRKLYDTQRKKYVSLNDIQIMIQSGAEIQVIKNESGEDITSQTLADIIAGAEKDRSGFLPQELLTSLIRTGQDRLTELQQAFSHSFVFNKLFTQELTRRLNALEKAELIREPETYQLIELLTSNIPGYPLPEIIPDEYYNSLLKEAKIPSRDDFNRLQDQLAQLNQQLDALLQPEADE